MTITNGYCTMIEFRQRFGLATVDGARDADIEKVIQAASRKIDLHCGRSFYSDTADSTKYFTAPSPYRVYVNDLQSVTALYTDDDGDQTYENTWQTTDYYLLPENPPSGWPYTYIEITPEGNYTFPRKLRKGVKITGLFGWAAVPDLVREACFLTANRYWQRRNAPFGVAGANEFGAPVILTKLDPDVIEMLAPYVKVT